MENGKRFMKGHTTNYLVVKMETEEELENRLEKVRVVGLDGLELVGASGVLL